jgi:hypothetical protein
MPKVVDNSLIRAQIIGWQDQAPALDHRISAALAYVAT